MSPSTPIMINDNRIDILSTPTAPGQAAQLDYRPKTARLHGEEPGHDGARRAGDQHRGVAAAAERLQGDRHDRRRRRADAAGGRDPQPGFVRPHRVHRGAPAGRRRRAGQGDRTEPDQAAAGRRQLPGLGTTRRARVGPARRDRQGDPEDQPQPRRRPDGLPGGRRLGEQGLRGRPRHRAAVRQQGSGCRPDAFFNFDGAGSDDRDRAAGSAMATSCGGSTPSRTPSPSKRPSRRWASTATLPTRASARRPSAMYMPRRAPGRRSNRPASVCSAPAP